MILVKSGILVRRDLIPDYFTDEAMEQIGLWNKYHTIGLPFAGGWAEQPAIYIDIIEALESQYRKVYGNQR